MGCIACLEKDDRYPHTCKKESTTMTCYRQHIIAQLVDTNKDKTDAATCSAHIECKGISCRDCPLDYCTTTMGDVRKLDERQKSKDSQAIEGVTKPSHYMLFDDIEAIEVIARSMTVEQFKGYCFGNIMKYRLRAGKKSELAYLEKDLAKADFYKELFEKHKDKCYA